MSNREAAPSSATNWVTSYGLFPIRIFGRFVRGSSVARDALPKRDSHRWEKTLDSSWLEPSSAITHSKSAKWETRSLESCPSSDCTIQMINDGWVRRSSLGFDEV